MRLATRLSALLRPAATPWQPDRIVALDLARFLALLGMFSEHLLLGKAPGPVLAVVTGFPSTLFAVLGGVSVVVSTRRLLEEGRTLAACVSVAVRGVLLALIGLALGAVPSFIVMVLSYYGVALIVVACLIWLPTGALLTLAATLTLASPHLILWARSTGPTGAIPFPSLASPLDFLQTVLFTGFYPGVTWITFLLFGVCAGRLLVRAARPRRAALTLLLSGAVMAAAGATADLLSRPLVTAALIATGQTADKARELTTAQGFGTPLGGGWIAVLSAAPHTGTTADILRTGGVALFVLAVLLLLVPLLRSPLPLPLAVVARAGSAPLTLYVAHFFGIDALILLTILVPTKGAPWWSFGPGAIAIHTAAALAVGAYLLRTGRRGPLEAFISRRVHAVADRLPGGALAPARSRSRSREMPPLR
ncbi:MULTISPECIES: heparan-alpha-glucosaminide N-acetyltransferase domain-containing protein [unclassified Rathayibacter]|uniref:heparan-alpha-glucosaminide N-acetyltransferase domain-containing protein n=1 Tax=unclassified Rathayibacter TaxID=2609250 RepID=UPI00188C6A0E|nr:MULTISPECIES: heparan-alpha-glucosaminide N-acetyltransferase domain-containing protein [unclassified Rathayibacter]MBF4461329.1 DUF1624 domain-containing protein [Rathayibacter sp. VKM Ac-2879]MBF4502740.1 DUF1624 domain-containing protein [Rathayibacter sp. VKM Ac-2878]